MSKKDILLRCCCRSALPAHTRCPAPGACPVQRYPGCSILHAPPPCLSTGGRIGCDRRSRFALPTVCVSAGARRPSPPPFQASTPVRVCILPHRPRHDIGARALISPFPLPLTPIPSACRFYVGLPSTLLISVHVPSPSRVPPMLSSPPSKAPVRHRSRNAPRLVALSPVVGTAVFLMRSEPFSPSRRRRAERPDALRSFPGQWPAGRPAY